MNDWTESSKNGFVAAHRGGCTDVIPALSRNLISPNEKEPLLS